MTPAKKERAVADERTLTTYRRADGAPVLDRYDLVLNAEPFAEPPETVEVIEETWTLTSSRPITFEPN
jgi:hypothetical protein